MKKDLHKIKFSVLGAGRSGLAVAKLLKKNGASVFLSEGN
jgi:UDP-N-acetylmuramoylalanine-D-glutamate ligase